jgi:hypothetical protein
VMTFAHRAASIDVYLMPSSEVVRLTVILPATGDVPGSPRGAVRGGCRSVCRTRW